MKFFSSTTTATFEQPSVGNWLIVFACGFLTVCIISPMLGIGLWFAKLVARALKAPVLPAIFDIPVQSAVHVILLVAAAFGALLATLMWLEAARRKRQEILIQAHHPIIGDFECSPYYQVWHAHPVLPSGQAVRLSAPGRNPSAAQAALWEQFIAQFDELSFAAKRALLKQRHPLLECPDITLTPSGITLTQEGELHLGFGFTTVPELFWTSENEKPYPTANFTSALKLKGAEWLTTYR